MDNKQIEETVKISKELYEIRAKDCGNIPPYALSEEAKALHTLLSLAQLFLSVNEKMPKKYGYLHSKEGCQCDSCKIVNIKNQCHDEFTAWLISRINEGRIIEAMKSVPHALKLENTLAGKPPEIDWDWEYANFACAIKTMILGGELV